MNRKNKNIQVIIQASPFEKIIKGVPYTKYFEKLLSVIKKININHLYDLKIDSGDNKMIIISDDDNKIIISLTHVFYSDNNVITIYEDINERIKFSLIKIILKYLWKEFEYVYRLREIPSRTGI